MKKFAAILFSIGLVFSLAACGTEGGQDETGRPSQQESASEPAGTLSPEDSGTSQASDNTENPSESGNSGGQSGSTVYFTADISPEGMMAIYEALGWTPEGKVAVKLSTGEPPASNYLRSELIQELVQSVEGTIVECNTAYGGSRTETAMHMQVAEDHGFTAIADADILNAEGSVELPVEGGSYLETNYVGSHFTDYDSYIVLSH